MNAHSAVRLVSHRAAPLGPTNDRILAFALGGERALRRLRPDTRTLAMDGDVVGTFDLAIEDGREDFVDALGLAGATADAVRATLAWATGHRARLAELALIWTTTDAVPSRLAVGGEIRDVLALAKAMPEAGRQIEDLYLAGPGSTAWVDDLDGLRAAFPALKTLWTCESVRHLPMWELATRGRRDTLAPPPWVRASGVTCWSIQRGRVG